MHYYNVITAKLKCNRNYINHSHEKVLNFTYEVNPTINKTSNRLLTAFAGPRVEYLITMTRLIGEEPVVTAVVERSGVIRRWVVAVRLPIALILASTCDVGHVHSQNKCSSKMLNVLVSKINTYWNNNVSHVLVSLRK